MICFLTLRSRGAGGPGFTRTLGDYFVRQLRYAEAERRVAAAFLADLDRAVFDRRAAAVRACRDSDCLDAA